MLTCFRSIFLALALTTVGASAVIAQDRGITREQFQGYLSISREATGESPFRNRTVIVTSENPTGPWKPYSSWISEVVLPDRSHLAYTSGRVGEFIHIGKRSFSKQADGIWQESENTIRGSMSVPAARVAFGKPVVIYTETRSHAGPELNIVTIIRRPDANAQVLGKDTVTYTYSFDRNGVLIEFRSIAHNGYNWVRRTESFEYDSEIKIDAPIN